MELNSKSGLAEILHSVPSARCPEGSGPGVQPSPVLLPVDGDWRTPKEVSWTETAMQGPVWEVGFPRSDPFPSPRHQAFIFFAQRTKQTGRASCSRDGSWRSPLGVAASSLNKDPFELCCQQELLPTGTSEAPGPPTQWEPGGPRTRLAPSPMLGSPDTAHCPGLSVEPRAGPPSP